MSALGIVILLYVAYRIGIFFGKNQGKAICVKIIEDRSVDIDLNTNSEAFEILEDILDEIDPKSAWKT